MRRILLILVALAAIVSCTGGRDAEAYRFFLVTVETLFKFGAAIELCRLGYTFEKVNLG